MDSDELKLIKNEERYKDLKKASWVTIVENVILAAGKLVIGVISSSTAVVADAIHTLSDIFTTFLVLFGLKLSRKNADSDHPYGHHRIESVISLLLACALAVTAVFLGYEGADKLINKKITEPSVWAFIITIISIIIKEIMFQYTMRKAKKHNSSSMMSDAWHHRSDAFSSVAVLIGLIGARLGAWYLDPVAAIAVCLIILKAVYDIGKIAINQLVDKSADEDICDRINKLVFSVDGVEQIDLLQTRVCNNVIFVDLEISIDQNKTVLESHKIAEEVHDLLEDSHLSIEHCMVHINPSV